LTFSTALCMNPQWLNIKIEWFRKKSPRPSLPRTRESPAAGLISLDSRVRGNDNNGCFLTFYEFVKIE